MKDWNYLFEAVILDRGFDYYEYGHVDIVSSSNARVEAIVHGTYDYDVLIVFNNDSIKSMYCDCPYFSHANCKHIAATLYYLDNHPELLVSDLDDRAIMELINSVKRDELYEFLLNEFRQNNELLNRFKLIANVDIDGDFYKNKLRSILANKYCTGDVIKFLNNDIQLLFDGEQYSLILESLKMIFKELFKRSEYGNYEPLDEIVHFSEDILFDLAGTSVADDARDFVNDYIGKTDDLYIDEILTDILNRIG